MEFVWVGLWAFQLQASNGLAAQLEVLLVEGRAHVITRVWSPFLEHVRLGQSVPRRWRRLVWWYRLVDPAGGSKGLLYVTHCGGHASHILISDFGFLVTCLLFGFGLSLQSAVKKSGKAVIPHTPQ